MASGCSCMGSICRRYAECEHRRVVDALAGLTATLAESRGIPSSLWRLGLALELPPALEILPLLEESRLELRSLPAV